MERPPIDQEQTEKRRQSASRFIRPQITLSDNGDLIIKGEIPPEQIQALTDAAILKQKLFQEQNKALRDAAILKEQLFQEYQQEIKRSSDRTALLIGAMLAGLLGLSVFMVCNTKPQPTLGDNNAVQSVPVFFR
ncbi:hypothetical protein [Anabaena azotica]|uniref:Uncharacterized protein n=1 Tax=Anabaena azotica FACHB-119 TaxID=947527 RepID=A0ABR8D9N8_9NOST|nr:hypothetical protein [Anabaena azotica]MBD2503928.1 hypothetical protein [Anabaena azotica FACHB-119]